MKELDRYGSESFCRGGGGRIWMDQTIGKRINVERSEEIVANGATDVAVSCPLCLTMIEDGMKKLNKEEEIKTKDITELLVSFSFCDQKHLSNRFGIDSLHPQSHPNPLETC